MTGAASLAAFMKGRKLSQGDLASMLKLSEGYVSLLLSGQRHAGLEVAFRIEKRTGGAVPATSWRRRKPVVRRRASRASEHSPKSSQ